jgi:hypothetical protein
VIRNRKKNDHRHFSIQTPGVQVGEEIYPRAHESRPKAECLSQIVGGKNSVVDPLQANNTAFDGHADHSSIGVYISRKEGRQASRGACVLRP